MAKSSLNHIRLITIGILYAILAQIVHTIGAILSMGYYKMPEYFPIWSKIMMPTAGTPPPAFVIYSLLFGLITGMILVIIYDLIKGVLPGKTLVKKGILYGYVLFLVSAIPSTMSMYLLINLPGPLILLWTVESAIIYLIGGIIIAKMVK